MDYGVDKGRERVVSSPGFGDPWYGGFYRRGFYRPVIVRGPGGRRYVYGYRDPFLWGGFGPGWGYNDVSSYTVYSSGLNLQINRAADGHRLFEGHAEAQSREKRSEEHTSQLPTLIHHSSAVTCLTKKPNFIQ